MSWIKLLIDIALAIIPGIALKGKKNLEVELEVAKKTIDLLSHDISEGAKAEIVKDAVNSLKAVKNYKKSLCKKFDKAQVRIYKKFF